MPMPGFISSFADKAQSALSSTPLAGVTGGSHRPSSPDAAHQASANHAAAHGGLKSTAFDAIQYQIRALGQQYSSATPLQRIITVEKGVAIDFDSVSRDGKSQSKELYTWGQHQAEDIKDVSDRLAYLNFVQGSLASSLALKLDSARSPFKALRDLEASLVPRRNIRAGLEAQVGRMEHDQIKGTERKLAELKEQLKKTRNEDDFLEKEFELKKRKALKESEQMKWDAFREYGEKIVLLSQAGSAIIAALPVQPPSAALPYTGTQTTGAVRASLQRALDNYKTGYIELPITQNSPAKLNRSDTLSFGESHASELSSIASTDDIHYEPGLPMTPPADHQQFSSEQHASPKAETHQLPSAVHASQVSTGSQPAVGASDVNTGIKSSAPPAPGLISSSMDTSSLNKSPAPGSAQVPSVAPPSSSDTSANNPLASTPTIAETGTPVKSNPEGPGPASGSLLDIKAASPLSGPRSGGLPGNESSIGAYGKEFESGQHQGLGFQRDRVDSPAATATTTTAAAAGPAAAVTGTGIGTGSVLSDARSDGADTANPNTSTSLPSSGSAPPLAASSGNAKYETAEEEKKRLQREERDRVLGVAGTNAGGSSASSAPGYEAAEDEKKRLEREERERILHGEAQQGGPSGPNAGGDGKKDEELPPYQDY